MNEPSIIRIFRVDAPGTDVRGDYQATGARYNGQAVYYAAAPDFYFWKHASGYWRLTRSVGGDDLDDGLDVWWQSLGDMPTGELWLQYLLGGGDPLLARAIGHAQAADTLGLTIAGVEVKHLAVVGTIPGVAPLLAAARNGPGTGALRWDASGLCWKAPGSTAFGPPVLCTVDGEVLLCDGLDHDRWLRAWVAVAWLPAGTAEGPAYLSDVYGAVAGVDVAAAEATAGDVLDYQITIENRGRNVLARVVCWLSAAAAGLEISADDATYAAPTTEATALALADMPAGATQTLYLRRTIAAEAAPDPAVLDLLHFAFDGL
ncbi:MAG: hypothetical protein IMZ54_00445 [Acidobacteria bacterium]|nr:hypothetical protein [Acidobacteriota bacterium]